MKNKMTYDETMELLAPAIDDYLISVDTSKNIISVVEIERNEENDLADWEKIKTEKDFVRSLREQLEESAESIDNSGMKLLNFDGFSIEWIGY